MPLLERLRYLCISCTNLDEFFEIRAGTLRHAQDLGLATGRRRPVAGDGAGAHPRPRRANWCKRSTNAGTRCCARRCGEAGVRVLGRDAWNDTQTRLAARRISATRSCRCCRRWGSIRRTRSRRSSTSRSTSSSCSRARTRSAARATWRSCARRARCRASSRCPRKSPAASTTSCSCRRCCRPSSTSCSRACRSRARTSSASPATPNCWSTRKKSTTSRWRCATNWSAAATCARCGWRSPSSARTTSCARCWRTST